MTISLVTNPPGVLVQPVEGLVYYPGFLPSVEQSTAVDIINASANEWRNDIRRRTQHYGWRYDYRAKAITPDMHLGRLPFWLQRIAKLIHERAVHPHTGVPLFDRVPEQCIVNEYVGSQGIAEHTDHRGFGPVIATVSLLAEWPMLLAPGYRNETIPVNLAVGSCLVMTGASRHVWTHQIEQDQWRSPSERRLSLTFRTVLNQNGIND